MPYDLHLTLQHLIALLSPSYYATRNCIAQGFMQTAEFPVKECCIDAKSHSQADVLSNA
jgi:hypothetical protein